MGSLSPLSFFTEIKMTIEHNAITDPEIHEPKGIAAATQRQVYMANGGGTGSWTLPVLHWANASYIEYATPVTISNIGNDFQVLDLWQNGVGVGLNADNVATTGYFIPSAAGMYQINFDMTFKLAAAGDAGDYYFKILFGDTGHGDITTSTVGTCIMTTTTDGVFYHVSLSMLDGGHASGEHIGIGIASDEALDTDDIVVYTANLTAFMVAPI